MVGTSRGKRNARFYSYLPAWRPLPGWQHQVKAASREAGALKAPALREWRRSGPMATSRWDT